MMKSQDNVLFSRRLEAVFSLY